MKGWHLGSSFYPQVPALTLQVPPLTLQIPPVIFEMWKLGEKGVQPECRGGRSRLCLAESIQTDDAAHRNLRLPRVRLISSKRGWLTSRSSVQLRCARRALHLAAESYTVALGFASTGPCCGFPSLTLRQWREVWDASACAVESQGLDASVWGHAIE